jgi:hypothetical protein
MAMTCHAPIQDKQRDFIKKRRILLVNDTFAAQRDAHRSERSLRKTPLDIAFRGLPSMYIRYNHRDRCLGIVTSISVSDQQFVYLFGQANRKGYWMGGLSSGQPRETKVNDRSVSMFTAHQEMAVYPEGSFT